MAVKAGGATGYWKAWPDEPGPGHMTRRIANAILAVAILGCGGCMSNRLYKPHYVASQQDAAAMNIAVTQVAPWNEYVQALSPNFTLSADAALTKALPTTALLETEIIDALVGNVAVGFAQSSTTQKKTVTNANGQESTNATSTESREPGQVTSAPPVPTPAAKSTLQPKNTTASALSDNPMLQYSAATALFQEVQLLDRYVRDAALRSGYEPYIVRVQLQVLPLARNEPYDVYALLGFFGWCDKGMNGEQPNIHPDTRPGKQTGCSSENAKLLALPLLVTDNLEKTVASRTSDVIRQLSLALNALRSGNVGNLGLTRNRERLDSILGADTNSLLTVGRVTDNTISARFGAPTQATAGEAMVPRTHNLTLLVMAPLKWAKSSGTRMIDVVARWTMRDAHTGKILPAMSEVNYRRRVETYLRGTIGDLLDASTPQERVQWIERLKEAIFKNDFRGFRRTLCETGWTGIEASKCEESTSSRTGLVPRDVWLEMTQELQALPEDSARFELPPYRTFEAPSGKQAILLVDNGKDHTTAIVRGGKGMVDDELTAVLTLRLRDGSTLPLDAESISVDSASSAITLNFPSIAKWKIGEIDRAGSRLVGATLTLDSHDDDKWNTVDKGQESPCDKQQKCPCDNGQAYACYRHILYRVAAADQTPLYSIHSPVVSIRSNQAGGGTVELYIELRKGSDGKPLANKLELSVDGAILASAKSSTQGSLPVALGKTMISQAGTVTLNLTGLVTGTNITVSSAAKSDAGENQGPSLAALKFPVK